MEKKVQYKFQITNNFVNKARIKGIKFSSPTKHAYTYFKTPKTNKNYYTVLRLKKSNGAQKLDMKIRNNKTGEWEHFESMINNDQQMQAILERLNCQPIFTFHKRRQTWQNKLIRLDLDTTKELGTFLEVKFNLKDKIKAKQFLRNLGVNSNKQDRRSVIEIYLEKYKK